MSIFLAVAKATAIFNVKRRYNSMIEIVSLQKKSILWEKTISYANDCTWRAGKYLACLMKENAFKEWERVFIAKDENEQIVGFCTFTEKDELPDTYEFTPFIGFMFVDERYRGQRISEKLISGAASYAKTLGYENIYIMSGEIGLYEKYGFKLIGVHETIYDSCEQLFVKSI